MANSFDIIRLGSKTDLKAGKHSFGFGCPEGKIFTNARVFTYMRVEVSLAMHRAVHFSCCE